MAFSENQHAPKLRYLACSSKDYERCPSITTNDVTFWCDCGMQCLKLYIGFCGRLFKIFYTVQEPSQLSADAATFVPEVCRPTYTTNKEMREHATSETSVSVSTPKKLPHFITSCYPFVTGDPGFWPRYRYACVLSTWSYNIHGHGFMILMSWEFSSCILAALNVKPSLASYLFFLYST